MSFASVLKSLWWKFKRGVLHFLVRISNYLFDKELIHRSRLARWFNQRWLAIVEVLSPARRRQARFERENPDAPWFVPGAIAYIEQELRPEFVGFEWGSGRSTLWFARQVRHVTSVEGRRSWFEEVGNWLVKDDLTGRVTLHLAEVTSEYGYSMPEIKRYAGAIDDVDDVSLDFIVVDGHFREACLRRVANKLRPGGLLVIDNSEVVPKSLLDSLRSANTQAWNNGIWETTVIHWRD
jgi:hypothetical protein